MHLDYYGTLKTVKTLASNQGLALVFEEGLEGAYTSGKSVHVPTPSPNWTEEEIIVWLMFVFHEIRHNIPEFRECFGWARKNKVDMSSFIGKMVNEAEDYRIEKYQNGRYDGERYALAKGRQIIIEQKTMPALGRDKAQLTAQIKKELGEIPKGLDIDEIHLNQDRGEALNTWYQGLREQWQPELTGLPRQMYEQINPRSQAWVDKLKAGNYADRLNTPGILDIDEQYKVIQDIMAEVFEMDPEQEIKKMQEQYEDHQAQQGQGNKQKKGKKEEEKRKEAGRVAYEHMETHDHDGKPGATYTPLKIDYDNHINQHDYIPCTIDQIKEYDMKRGDLAHGNNGYVRAVQAISGGGLDKSVLRLLQVMSKTRPVYGQKRGKLATRSLHRIFSPNPNTAQKVFKQKKSTLRLDSAVCVLCDLSGSMGGDKYVHAAKAAVMLNNAVSKLGVPLEVLGFTTSDYSNIAHVIFKDFSSSVDEIKLTEYFDRAADLMYRNADGESILWAYSRLIRRKEPKKVLIVLSDGQPSANRNGDIMGFTQDVVKDIEKRGDIDIFGIGLGDASVSRIYKKHTVIDHADQLESKLLDLVKTKIIGD